jgi:transposase
VAETVAAQGEVWFADATTLREFPPLRCAWTKQGEQATVVISGRNARRVLYGALNVQTGELVQVVRERSRGDDIAALCAELGAGHPFAQDPITAPPPSVSRLLVLDNAPPHHTHRARDAAAAAGLTLVYLPFRSPELNPIEDLWRALKAKVAANRCYPSVDELAARATAWLATLTATDRLRLTGLLSSKFDWLPT